MNIKQRLVILSFLQFFIWGSWLISTGGYLFSLGFKGIEIGSVYSTLGIASLFMPAILGIVAEQTISKDKKGNIIVKQENLKDFGISISMAPKGSLDERTRYDVVKTDGPLAIAWTPYSFYYQEKFSHCGVNSFQLIKTANGWKIQYLIDTRRRAGCE